jgi:hypothetical protein
MSKHAAYCSNLPNIRGIYETFEQILRYLDKQILVLQYTCTRNALIHLVQFDFSLEAVREITEILRLN